jgi:hypothetical protein
MNNAYTLIFALAPIAFMVWRSFNSQPRATVQRKPGTVKFARRIEDCMRAPFAQERLLRRAS